MMTVAGVLALALVDSINPSAIVVTLWLLSVARERASVQIATYVAAIFVTYLLLGAMMVAGIGMVLPSFGDLLRRPAGLIVQSLVGLALLVYGLTASAPSGPARVVSRPSTRTYAALALLGVGVTVMELPTAIPYFAAIAIIVDAELPTRAWAPLLAVYNLIFVLPPLALLAGHLVFEERLAARYAALRLRLESNAKGIALWVAGLVGGWLLVTGTIELVARLR
jgi:cytochrome c biogenesis protein CcdA